MTVLIVEGSLCVADSTSEGEADDSDGDIVHVNSDVASISGQFSFNPPPPPPRGNLFSIYVQNLLVISKFCFTSRSEVNSGTLHPSGLLRIR